MFIAPFVERFRTGTLGKSCAVLFQGEVVLLRLCYYDLLLLKFI